MKAAEKQEATHNAALRPALSHNTTALGRERFVTGADAPTKNPRGRGGLQGRVTPSVSACCTVETDRPKLNF